MAKTAAWRDELWRFYERVFGKNYRNYIHRLSNKENEVTVSFHVKGDELIVIASPSSLRVIKRKGWRQTIPKKFTIPLSQKRTSKPSPR